MHASLELGDSIRELPVLLEDHERLLATAQAHLVGKGCKARTAKPVIIPDCCS